MNDINGIIAGVKTNKHAKVVVAGIRGDNLPVPYHECPQLVLLSGDEASSVVLPSSTKLVLITRFVSHIAIDNLRKQCKRMSIPFSTKTYGTGELKSLLSSLLEEEEPKVITGVAGPKFKNTIFPEDFKLPTEPTPIPFSHGELTEFVRTHFNPKFTTSQAEESRRIMQLATEKGYTTPSLTAVQSAVSRLVISMKPDTPPPPPAPAALLPPSPQPSIVAPQAVETIDDADRELLQMLQDASAAIALAREELIRRSAEFKQLREIKRVLGMKA